MINRHSDVIAVISEEGEESFINNPSQYPEEGHNKKFEEPIVLATIVVPADHYSNCLSLCEVSLYSI